MPVNVSRGLLSKTLHWGLLASPTFTKAIMHLRSEAGDRQVEGTSVGHTHVVGLTSACAVHILQAGTQ